MPMTKKLEKLLLKYKKANRARLTAYAKRSRTLRGTLVANGQDCNGWQQWKREHKVPLTDDLKSKLDADIEIARLYRLEVSKELRTYCKKKKLHLQWNSDNGIKGVHTHMGWKLRRYPFIKSGNTLLHVLRSLKLSTQNRYFI